MPQTRFTSSVHGWPFPNSFEYSPRVLGLRKVSCTFGFCGGMCRTAVLRYRRGEPIARDLATPPAQGSPLYDEIFQEQLRAMREDAAWHRVLKWMRHPDGEASRTWLWRRESLARLVRGAEWPALKRRLDEDDPTILCLIRTRGAKHATDNHIVVATGYEHDEATGLVAVGIYDPNYPDLDDVSILFRLAGDSLQGTQSTGEPLRAFFQISHEGLDPVARSAGV